MFVSESKLIVVRVKCFVFVWHLNLFSVIHKVPDRYMCSVLAQFLFLLELQLHFVLVLRPKFVAHQNDVVNDVELTEDNTHHVLVVTLDPV